MKDHCKFVLFAFLLIITEEESWPCGLLIGVEVGVRRSFSGSTIPGLGQIELQHWK